MTTPAGAVADPPAAESKPAVETKPAAEPSKEPDYSKLVAPKDSGFDADYIAKHGEWAKAGKITPEHAQAVLDLRHADRVESLAAFGKESAEWGERLKRDPIFGGKQYEANVKSRDALLARALTAIDSLDVPLEAKAEFKAQIDEFRGGPWLNFALFSNVLAAVGHLFAEKPSVEAKAPAVAQSVRQREFPNSPQMDEMGK